MNAPKCNTILDASVKCTFAPVPCPSCIKPTKISIFNRFGWMLVGLRNNTNVHCAYSNLQRPHQTTVTKYIFYPPSTAEIPRVSTHAHTGHLYAVHFSCQARLVFSIYNLSKFTTILYWTSKILLAVKIYYYRQHLGEVCAANSFSFSLFFRLKVVMASSDTSDANLFEAMLNAGNAGSSGLLDEDDNGALQSREKCQSKTASGDASASLYSQSTNDENGGKITVRKIDQKLTQLAEIVNSFLFLLSRS